MRFSSREQYGLRLMAELASHYGEGYIPLSEVAEAQGIPLATLEQVIAPLRRAGLVISTRGATGGYTLARPPAEMTVGDVLRVLEGGLVPIPCLDADGVRCERVESCATRPVWALVRDRLVETLDRLTLEDVCRQRVDEEKL
ncbi:MAG: Rrf2 family transcriptional regulator [Anaerolineae bacterium]|nr:Rrf2 family transcriptional regulator [Anaerolineae bacterium]